MSLRSIFFYLLFIVTMTFKLVTYDLIGWEPLESYKRLYAYLSKFDCIKPLESVWILRTSKSANELAEAIIDLIDSNDKVFVCEFDNASFDWLSDSDKRRLFA